MESQPSQKYFIPCRGAYKRYLRLHKEEPIREYITLSHALYIKVYTRRALYLIVYVHTLFLVSGDIDLHETLQPQGAHLINSLLVTRYNICVYTGFRCASYKRTNLNQFAAMMRSRWNIFDFYMQ